MDSDSHIRWYIKKWTRKGLVAAYFIFRRFQSQSAKHLTHRVRVLTYHRFGDLSYDPYCISEQVFEAHMSYLHDSGKAICFQEFQSFLDGSFCPPQDAMLVTVDDGDCSLHARALPILIKYRIPVVAFIPVGRIDNPADFGRLTGSSCSWAQIRELRDCGVTIGSHGWAHCSLAQVSPVRARDDAVRSRKALEDHIGAEISAFAYPYGTRADLNAITSGILKDSGYSCAFTSMHGPCFQQNEPYSIPRIKIESGEGLWSFPIITKGGLDKWGIIDRKFWRFQTDNRNGL